MSAQRNIFFSGWLGVFKNEIPSYEVVDSYHFVAYVAQTFFYSCHESCQIIPMIVKTSPNKLTRKLYPLTNPMLLCAPGCSDIGLATAASHGAGKHRQGLLRLKDLMLSYSMSTPSSLQTIFHNFPILDGSPCLFHWNEWGNLAGFCFCEINSAKG